MGKSFFPFWLHAIRLPKDVYRSLIYTCSKNNISMLEYLLPKITDDLETPPKGLKPKKWNRVEVDKAIRNLKRAQQKKERLKDPLSHRSYEVGKVIEALTIDPKPLRSVARDLKVSRRFVMKIAKKFKDGRLIPVDFTPQEKGPN